MSIASYPTMRASSRAHPRWECTWCGRKWSWVEGLAPKRDRRGHVICGTCSRLHPVKTIKRGAPTHELVAPSRLRPGPFATGLAVTCWCEADVVVIPSAELARGMTGSCGREKCSSIHDRQSRAKVEAL